jgi:hypothetical protein
MNQTDSVQAQIQPIATHQNPPPASRGAAHRIYSLAQKYRLRREALQATRAISECPMGVEGSRSLGLCSQIRNVQPRLSSQGWATTYGFKLATAAPTYDPMQRGLEWANAGASHLKKQLGDVVLPSAPRPALNTESVFRGASADSEAAGAR